MNSQLALELQVKEMSKRELGAFEQIPQWLSNRLDLVLGGITGPKSLLNIKISHSVADFDAEDLVKITFDQLDPKSPLYLTDLARGIDHLREWEPTWLFTVTCEHSYNHKCNVVLETMSLQEARLARLFHGMGHLWFEEFDGHNLNQLEDCRDLFDEFSFVLSDDFLALYERLLGQNKHTDHSRGR